MTLSENFFKLSTRMDQVFDQLSETPWRDFSWDAFINRDTNIFPSYPKTNCYVSEDQSVTIECAVAGMTKENIKVELENTILTIEATKPDGETVDKKFLTRGLAQRSFTIKYQLSKSLDAEKTKVKVENGMLTIIIPSKPEMVETPKKIALSIE